MIEKIMNVSHFHEISNSTACAMIVFFLIIAVLRCCKSTISNQRNADRLPPGPPLWPILGHLHLFKKDQPLHQTLWFLAQRYGPIMHLRLGCRPILVVSSPDLARECLSTNDKIFASRPQFAGGEHLGYNSTMLGFHPYDQQWRNLRRITTLEILSARKTEMWKHVRTEEVSALVRSLFQQADGNEKVNVRPRLLELSFNIISRMVTGIRIFRPDNNNNNRREVEAHQFHAMIEEFAHLSGAFNIGDYIPSLRCLDLQGCERAMKILHSRTDAILQRLVEEHRDRHKMETHDGNGQSSADRDFIDVLLLSFPDNDSMVKSTAMALIVAATDTSSVAIEWALACVLQNPDICKKAQEELDAHVGRDRIVEESDLADLKYLQAIVKETLRLYPSVPLLLPHQSTEGCSVGGYYVPAGTRLLVNVWAIQRDPVVWERPAEFDPERFSVNPSIDMKGQDFELFPFGSGRRACPGTSLALQVTLLAVGRLLQGFDWISPEAMDMSEGIGLTMPKAVPLRATLKPRLSRHLY